MITKAIYRLHEYRITEDEGGRLWWETHAGFGEQLAGQCFIYDDILVLGGHSHQRIGFLKGEFLGSLEKLPAWNKTRYYCPASELREVATGQGLSEDFLQGAASPAGMKGTRAKAAVPQGPGAFQLDKYRISAAADGKVSWQAHDKRNNVVGGPCLVQSGVLFIGPQEYQQADQDRHDFRVALQELPRWDMTRLFCRSLALRPCAPEPSGERDKVAPEALRDTADETPYHEKKAAADKAPKPPNTVRPMAFKHYPTLPPLPERLADSVKIASWRFRRPRKIWLIGLIPLILAGLVLGLILALHSVEERSHHDHETEEHHRERNDHD